MEDLDDLALLEIETAPTLVGKHRLTVETMTMARQKALKGAVDSLDLKPIVEALMPIIGGAEAGLVSWTKVIAEHANTLKTEVMNLLGGEVLADLAAVMLDTEENYDAIVEAAKVKFAKPKRGRFDAYLGSEDFRDFVKDIVTPKQASHAIRKAIEISKYREMGKDLFGAVMGGMATVTQIAAKTNGTPVESVPDGATM